MAPDGAGLPQMRLWKNELASDHFNLAKEDVATLHTLDRYYMIAKRMASCGVILCPTCTADRWPYNVYFLIATLRGW